MDKKFRIIHICTNGDLSVNWIEFDTREEAEEMVEKTHVPSFVHIATFIVKEDDWAVQRPMIPWKHKAAA